jgi:DNA-binding transcriptional LysR family regulator
MLSSKISLRHLRCFVEVANSGSFTVAASKLFVTQSSLTATIQQFEETVDLRLFDRTTRRVVLTTEAARFKIEAERLLKDFDGAISDLGALAQGKIGHVRIAAAASIIHYFLVNAIDNFRKKSPGVTVTLRDAGAQMVEQMLIDGDVDFAVASALTGSDELQYDPLLEDRYGIVCRADHELARESGPIRWETLNAAEFVELTDDTGIGRFLRSSAPHSKLFSESHDQVSSTTSVYALLNVGNRYTILPALASNLGSLTNFAFRELCEPTLTRKISVITRRNRSLSHNSRRILTALGAEITAMSLPNGVTISSKFSADDIARDR